MAGRFWREAASLIVVGRSVPTNVKINKLCDTDYRLLLLKRSEKSSFMPNSLVFPGGVIEASDFSQDWLDIFGKYGYTSSDLQNEFRNPSPLPEFYTNKPADYILPELGFRIAAIRETFEECGLLLARHLPGSSLEQCDVQQWCKAVYRDASQFLTLFHELGGCPAVWDLHEWMNWLTPHSWGSRRFDTAFYITFMDHMPRIGTDNKEIVSLKVASPPAILDHWQRKELHLPPPQVYEISRLLNFQQYEKLERFAHRRGKRGIDRYMPVVIPVSDGFVSLLPGDDLYPEDPDYLGEREVGKVTLTISEFRETATHLNRIEIRGRHDISCFVNIQPKYGHLTPINSLQALRE